jgi:hypothetical protein
MLLGNTLYKFLHTCVNVFGKTIFKLDFLLKSVVFWVITRRRVVIITTRRRVITQKTTDFINIAAEAWNLDFFISYFIWLFLLTSHAVRTSLVLPSNEKSNCQWYNGKIIEVGDYCLMRKLEMFILLQYYSVPKVDDGLCGPCSTKVKIENICTVS